MQGTYSYYGPNKSVPYHYPQQSSQTQQHHQHQSPPLPALMQRQHRSWKKKTPVMASPPKLTLYEHPHSDSFLFPRDKGSSGYPVVFPRSKSDSGARIHLSDIKIPIPSTYSTICQWDPLITTSKIPLDVSSMSNHKKKSNYALNTTTASSTKTQHGSSPANHQQQCTKNRTDIHHHHNQQQIESSCLDYQQPQQRKKHQQQQDRRRFSATLDSQIVPPHRRFSHPENYGSQSTGVGQMYHFPYHRHSHHQQQRHQPHHTQQQQYYHLTTSAYVYPPLSITGYSSPHGMYAQPHHQHHSSYYQPYQGYNHPQQHQHHHHHHHHHHSTAPGFQKASDNTTMDDDLDDDNDDNNLQRRISTNTNTDTTSTVSSSDMAPRRFSSGSTGSSSKSTLASSMGSVGIWNTDSISSSTNSIKTTTTSITTPAISSATITAAATTTPTTLTATKVDETAHRLDQPLLDQCDSFTTTHNPAAITTTTNIKENAQTPTAAADDDYGSVPLATITLESKQLVGGVCTMGDDLTSACDHHLNQDRENKTKGNSSSSSSEHINTSPQDGKTHCSSAPSSSVSSTTVTSSSSSSSSSSTTSSSSSTPQSPHTTPEPATTSSPPNHSVTSATTTSSLPVWADPIKVRDNPTRYKVVQDYMAEHKLSYTSSLPLHKDIVFYFGDTKTTMANYRSSMQKLFSSTTVWGFSSCWRCYKDTSGRKPSQMATNQNLYCFQKGVEPMWEDEVNKHGGRLILCPSKHIPLDDLFDWLLCAFVGGQLVAQGMVGLVLSRRARLDRMELWLDANSSTNPDTVVSIKNKLLTILPEALREPVMSSHYKKHYDQ